MVRFVFGIKRLFYSKNITYFIGSDMDDKEAEFTFNRVSLAKLLIIIQSIFILLNRMFRHTH